MKISKIFFGFSLLTAFGVNPSWADGLDVLKLPKGFHISIFAQGLENPRGMALSPEGVLYVCDMKPGKIFRLSGPDAQPQLVIEGLNKPHSLTFYQGKLYVGETNRISRFSDWSHHHWAEDGVKVVDLPDSGMHFTRTVAFGPDDKLYVSCGSDCNTCEESDNRRAAILRYNPDGT
ncbi:MAG TPA: sorbosone dehydrogenase family protein, partial [bacterium]